MDGFFKDSAHMLLRVGEVAELLQVSESTVTRWIRQGRIPAIRIERGWRIPRDELHTWLHVRRTMGGQHGRR